MKTTLIPISAATVCAVALVGCEWGGVHSGESWNDAYSWANFTGTYKLVSEIPAETDSEVAGASSTSSATINDAKKFTIAKGAGAASVSGLHTPITAGSLLVSCGSWNFKDDGAGNLVYQGSGSGFSGSVSYAAGSFSLTFGMPAPEKITGIANYTYTSKSTATATSSSGKVTNVTSPIVWLNVNQKGNLLTIEDNRGAIFSGKITGASCPTANEEGYVQAGHIRFTFEATRTANPRETLTGSISGEWSGSTSDKTGTIANRTIDASYHNGKTTTQFQAVSGTTTVYAKEISAAAGSTP